MSHVKTQTRVTCQHINMSHVNTSTCHMSKHMCCMSNKQNCKNNTGETASRNSMHVSVTCDICACRHACVPVHYGGRGVTHRMRHCAAVRVRGWVGCKGEAWRGTELTAAAAAAQSNARLAAAETAIESSSAASSAGVQAARDMQGHRWLNQRSRRSLMSCEVEPQ